MSLAVIRMLIFGRKSSIRLAAITAGIAIGMAGFLLLAGAFAGMQAREVRATWLDPAGRPAQAADVAPRDGMLALHTTDHYSGHTIEVLSLAGNPRTVTGASVPGGIPAAGGYLASPALADLITGSDLSRYGTHQVGVLPASALSSPDSLVVVRSAQPAELLASGQAQVVSDFSVNSAHLVTDDTAAIRTIVALGAIGILLPVILLVSVVTQLGLTQRQENLATLRLIGAPPAISRRLACVEAAATAVIGSVLGVGLSVIARPWAARIAVGDGSFYPADLALPPAITALACLLMVAIVVLAAIRRAQRAHIGPLGMSRQRAETPPGLARIALVAFGLVMLGILPIGLRGGWLAEGDVASAFLIIGFLATALGLMAVGPLLTWWASRLAARTARSAEALIAAGRIQTAPRATFRSVSGLVVAVFMVSVFAGAASAGAPEPARSGAGLMPLDALVASTPPPSAAADSANDAAVSPADSAAESANDAAALTHALRALPGIRHVAIVYPTPESSQSNDADWLVPAAEATALGLTNPATPATGYLGFDSSAYLSPAHGTAAHPIAIANASTLQPTSIIIRTDGSPAAIERARTEVEARWHTEPLTRAEIAAGGNGPVITQLYSVASAGVLIAISVAGITLAIASAAAVLDRKRVLGLLRLMGMPVGKLRSIVALEAVLPMVAVLALSVGLGLAVAYFIIVSLSERGMTMPAPQYFYSLAAGLVFAVGAIVVSFTSVRQNTATSVTRFE